MKKVDITLPKLNNAIEETMEYFHVKDFESLEVAVRASVESALAKEEPYSGFTMLFFDKFEDIELLPSYETTYWLNGEEVGLSEYELFLDTEEFCTCVHHVEWTKGLLGEDAPMCLMYHYSGNVEDTTPIEDFYNELLKQPVSNLFTKNL